MSDTREHDLVLLGATGFVGRLTAAYLAQHAPAGMRIALAGRSRQRLEAARAELPSAAHTWPLVVVDATDPAAAESLARSTRVVVTTVGPYLRYGMAVARACAEAGTHYADLTGELLFVRELADACHETARRTGARIVTSCGFDSVPSDLGVHLLHREAGSAGLGDTTLLATQLKGGFSGGTVDSLRGELKALEADPSRRRVYFDPFALSADRSAEPDAKRHRFAFYVFRDHDTGRWTGPFVMAAYNSRIVRRSNSLLGHAYGPDFRYREAVGFGRGVEGRLSAYGLAVALGGGMAAMSNPRLRPVVDRFLPSPGEGPSEQAQREGRFRVELRSRTSDGRRLLAVVSAKGDPGYAATAVMLGESGLCLAQDEPRLSPFGGVLTPAVAMGDALVDRLRAAGFRLTVGPDEG